MSNARNLSQLKPSTAGLIEENDIADAGVTPVKLSQKLTSGTAIATTSGTSKDVTGIPSWVKRITFIFKDVSTNGSSAFNLQVGSGSVQTTGYASSAWSSTSTTLTANNGFIASVGGAAFGFSGIMTLALIDSNTWVASGLSTIATTANTGFQAIGTVTLAGALDRLRFTTFAGTDTFDAGSINILYE